MMARFGRRKAAGDAGALGTDAEELEGEEWPGEETDQPTGTPLRRRMFASSSGGSSQDEEDLPSSRLRGNERTYGYAVGAVIAVASIIMLVVTGGAGAPKHPQPIWPVLGLVFGVATIATIRFRNRMLTSLVAIAGGFVSGQARTPNSLSGVKIVALLAPVLYGIMIFRRQSKADRALRASQPRMTAAERKAARGRGRGGAAAKDEPAPGRPKPSGRYTPPKSKTPPPKGSRAKR